MAYRNTFFRWLFLYSLTFGLTYVLKLFTYLCPETGQDGARHRRHIPPVPCPVSFFPQAGSSRRQERPDPLVGATECGGV